MRKITAIGLTALSLAGVVSATAAPAALASPTPVVASAHPIAAAASSNSSGSQAAQAGDKLGELIGSWGKAILAVVAGGMLIFALIERHVGKAITVFGLAALSGMFLYAPDKMANFFTAIANTLFG